MNQSKIKFSHHRANLNEDGRGARKYADDHVMTLARRIEDDKIYVGWAICTPGHWEPYHATLNVVREVDDVTTGRELFSTGKEGHVKSSNVVINKVKVRGKRFVRGDSFCKRTGREMALQRLELNPLVFDMKLGQAILEQVLNGIYAIHRTQPGTMDLAGDIARRTLFNRHMVNEYSKKLLAVTGRVDLDGILREVNKSTRIVATGQAQRSELPFYAEWYMRAMQWLERKFAL